MGKNRFDRPFGVAALPENLSALNGMLIECGMNFVVKVVNEPDQTPVVLGLAMLSGIRAHRDFHGQTVAAQAFALNVFGQQRPGFVP